MSKTGINFERCNVVSAQLHNERDAAYLESVKASGKATYEIFDDRTATNKHWTSKVYAGKTLEQILEDCRERYRRAVGQEPQEQDRVRKVKDKKTGLFREVTTAGWSPIREGVCPVKEDTKLQDFNPLIRHLAAKGVHVISIDIHRDEGYQDPVTGERKYNYHAHIIADWTDHETGKTAKLNKDDMSEVQTVLADALGMERGDSKEVTGKDHLTPARQREKAAAQNAKRLEEKIVKMNSELEQAQRSLDEARQREEDALERAAAAEKAASREQLRTNAADVGARFLGIIGRGAIAERDDALRRADDAERRAKEAENRQKEAERKAAEAETEKEYAESMAASVPAEKRAAYHRGFRAGYDQCQEDVKTQMSKLADEISILKQKLEYECKRTSIADSEIRMMTAVNPSMANWKGSLKVMKEAGMNDTQIRAVFMRQVVNLEIQIPSEDKHEVTVSLKPSRDGEMRVWFNGLSLANFKKAEKAEKKRLGPEKKGKGLKL